MHGFSLDSRLLDYEVAVALQDFDQANSLLTHINPDSYDDLARFLSTQGFIQPALQLARDPELKFDLAIKLEDVTVAFSGKIDRRSVRNS